MSSAPLQQSTYFLPPFPVLARRCDRAKAGNRGKGLATPGNRDLKILSYLILIDRPLLCGAYDRRSKLVLFQNQNKELSSCLPYRAGLLDLEPRLRDQEPLANNLRLPP